MWLRKARAGSAPGLTWEHDGDVLEVDDELGMELLARPGGEFTEASPPEQAQAARTAREVIEAPTKRRN